ncbi:MAG: peptidylprolyl isomerase [Anaerolineaceae bacterium]|nr:peptidylprolyl isomerase [Anaerolineaceae bacterium]
MKRQFVSISVILILTSVLAACANTETLTPTAAPSEMPLPTVSFEQSENQRPFEEAFPGEFSDCILSSEKESAPFPVAPASENEHWQGSAAPKITLIVYLDPQCPYCAALNPVLETLLLEYPNELQIVYRQMPLIMVHENALLASQALEAVSMQDDEAFFALQKILYSDQSLWELMTEDDFKNFLILKVEELKLDSALFMESLKDPELQTKILIQLDTALQAGITYSPFVLIDGSSYGNLPFDLGTMRTIIELTLLKENQFSECPPQLIEEGKGYIATLTTKYGDIIIELFPEVAPLAVNNFIFLSQQGWYDNNPFYRVLPDSFVLTGDPTGSSLGGPGYAFRNETDPSINFSLPGLVAMNNAGAPNTNGSQFFITYQPMTELNGKFTIFGQVIQGFDILNLLTQRDPMTDAEMIQPDYLLSVTIVSK